MWFTDKPILKIGSITTLLIKRGNGNANNAHIIESRIKCVPKFDAVVQPLSTLPFIKFDASVHVKYTAVSIAAIGIITSPIPEYIGGKIFDIFAITDANISHVQHEEKNASASCISTGEVLRQIENPAIVATPAASSHGNIAPADNGKNDKNTIKNFFNLLILFNYTTILPRCDINQIINVGNMFLHRVFFVKLLSRIILPVVLVAAFITPDAAFAKWEIVDRLNLAPFVPRVLDAFMMVARGVYEYFVGHGDGIIYIFVWGFLAISIFMYAFKMYFPKRWLEFFGLSGGGEMWDGKVKGFETMETVIKGAVRAIVAAVLLLQIKPIYVTQWLVNPFLEFGAIYTGAITDQANITGVVKHNIECPESILSSDWISQRSCNFLIQPVSDLSAVNNAVVKRGFEFVSRGIRGMITIFSHGGQNIMDVITGVLLIFTFVGCNIFMALLIIQGIFDFGVALILYPFSVLAWVAKKSDKWLDIWPAFDTIITALRKLVITMIACAFIMIINVAIVHALFGLNNSVFNVAAGGNASSNLVTTNAIGFGGHSMLWLSAILTFFLMNAIFEMTKKQIAVYAPGMNGLYDQAKSDFKATTTKAKDTFTSIKKIIGLIKK